MSCTSIVVVGLMAPNLRPRSFYAAQCGFSVSLRLVSGRVAVRCGLTLIDLLSQQMASISGIPTYHLEFTQFPQSVKYFSVARRVAINGTLVSRKFKCSNLVLFRDE